MNEITKENFRVLLAEFLNVEEVSVDDVAKSIGCPISSLKRLLSGETLPTDHMMKQCGVMFAISHDRYRKLSNAEKEKISETIGSVGGGILGFGVISAAISTAGVSGLSGAGITSGLAAIGGAIGGGMVAGVAMTAAIPIAIGTLGYITVKGVKQFFEYKKQSASDIDPVWEELKKPFLISKKQSK